MSSGPLYPRMQKGPEHICIPTPNVVLFSYVELT